MVPPNRGREIAQRYIHAHRAHRSNPPAMGSHQRSNSPITCPCGAAAASPDAADTHNRGDASRYESGSHMNLGSGLVTCFSGNQGARVLYYGGSMTVFAIPGFIWFLIAIILVLVILGWVFGRRRV